MWDHPLIVNRVTVKAATDLVLDTTACNLSQAEVDRLKNCVLLVTGEGPRQGLMQYGCLRELWCVTKTAKLRLLLIKVGDALQQVGERDHAVPGLIREIGTRKEGQLIVGRQKHRQGPTAGTPGE